MRVVLSAALLSAVLAATPVWAASSQMELHIKDRGFQPAELQVPAATKIKLVIHNDDSVPAEFESYDLSREVVVPGGSRVVVYIGPLDAGSYKFFNDFHPASTGHVIVGGAARP